MNLSGSQLHLPAGSGGFSSLSGLQRLELGGVRFLYNVSVYSDGFFTGIDYDKADLNALTAQFAGMDALEYLDVSSNQLESLEFAAALPRLSYLNAADNYVTDISPLAGCGALACADLSGNPVHDWTAAERDGLLLIR